MKTLLPNLDHNSHRALYLQLYDYIKTAILKKEIVPGDKLPSLRNLSDALDISLTTVDLAYSQLSVEGYIYSKPQSGYFVGDMFYPSSKTKATEKPSWINETENFLKEPKFYYDLECFDFAKWKKCINKVFLDYPQHLLFESDSQGEEILRYEISKYIYQSRGVKCSPDQVVIAAGTQQITNHLSNIMRIMNINNVAVEEPGYLPVINIFKDRGFAISHVPVLSDGIQVEKLPTNIQSAVYVNPSNQFPTGAVMPVAKRYKLLYWAVDNDSYIIEDDYDSELRYFGKPVPSLQGLDNKGKVIYLGSFSSTLFSSVKISYMVLPPKMIEVFQTIRNNYSQTCSKTEQLALALFMQDGKYQRGIKKLRRLYSQKLQLVLNILKKDAKDLIEPLNNSNGINILLKINGDKSSSQLVSNAKKFGLNIQTANKITEGDKGSLLIFYYNQIPISDIPLAISRLIDICS
ncbi:MAG: PLP-dependent aminotransferase family protein [Anaerovoracaceae bacterium]